MKKRLTATLLALIMLLASAGCTSNDSEGSNPGSENETKIESNEESANSEVVNSYEKPTLLTEVFSGNEVSLPSDYGVYDPTVPYVNSESGEITIIATKRSGAKKSHKLVVYDRDMNIVSESDIEIPLPSKKYSASSYVVFEDCIYCLYTSTNSNTYSTTYIVDKISYDGESLGVSQELNGLFDHLASNSYLEGFAVSENGYIYLATNTEVLVLNSDYVKQCSISSKGISSVAISDDGDAYVLAYFENSSGNYEQGVSKINLETKDLDDYIKISGRPDQLLFGDGHDFYIFHQDGVYCYDFAEDGSVSSSIIMDFQNSDITYSSLDIISVLDAENIVATYITSKSGESFIKYSKSDDIDVSTINLIDIACVVQTTAAEVTQNALLYNSEHKDSRIIISDYSGRSGSGKDFSRLVTDILNGLYAPDLILVYAQTHINTLIENGIYTDLSPYIDASEEFDRDDIFDSVFRHFSIDGKMWGISSAFEVGTLVGKTSVLGDRTSWTCDEFIDFALSLPEGQEVRFVNQNTASTIPGLYERFVDFDNNTCDFENEEFYKTLEFIASLPTEYPSSDPDNPYAEYQNDEYILKYQGLFSVTQFQNAMATFNTDELTRIGYPTNGENSRGGTVSCSISYIIPDCALNKDGAWDYITTSILNEDSFKYGGFSIFKDMVRKNCEKYYDSVVCYYFSGSSSTMPYDPEDPITEADLKEPGIIYRLDEESTEELIAYLNDGCGSPLSDTLPEEITNIISEEISSYISGAKTAEACAKIIQSRVGIYLAEHQ